MASTDQPPRLLPWNVRSWLLFYGLGAGVLYAGSFTVIAPTERVIAVAAAVTTAVVLTGTALLIVLSVRHPQVGVVSWLDALLLALRVGLWATLVSVLMNLGMRRGLGWLYPHLLRLHVAVALLANLAMLAVFLRRADARGIAPKTALVSWLVADVVFVVIAYALWPAP